MLRFNPLLPADDAVPPQSVRFTELKVEPWPDGNRVRVHVRLTPFQSPPNISFAITDRDGNEIARVNIIENIDFNFVITMHLRGQLTSNEFHLTGVIEYDEFGPVAESGLDFLI